MEGGVGVELEFPELGYNWSSPLKRWSRINENRPLFVHYLCDGRKEAFEPVAEELGVSLKNPNDAPEDVFKGFVTEVVKAVQFLPEDHEWNIALTDKYEMILEMYAQDELLDRVSDVWPFLLALAGDLSEAETMQKLIGSGKPEEAADYYKKRVGLL